MLNVHALGGVEMMCAALAGAHEAKGEIPLVIGVTVLTHLEPSALGQLGLGEPEPVVARLAGLVQKAGLDGVVCSPHEVQTIKRLCGWDFLTVTPGIRPAGSAHDDQRRVMTPRQAAAVGADYLVVGRPITQAQDPAAAARELLCQLKGAK
jgi:orotidine-5'-phosphate decarboxylase